MTTWLKFDSTGLASQYTGLHWATVAQKVAQRQVETGVESVNAL
jgi:hypothetical protein